MVAPREVVQATLLLLLLLLYSPLPLRGGGAAQGYDEDGPGEEGGAGARDYAAQLSDEYEERREPRSSRTASTAATATQPVRTRRAVVMLEPDDAGEPRAGARRGAPPTAGAPPLLTALPLDAASLGEVAQLDGTCWSLRVPRGRVSVCPFRNATVAVRRRHESAAADSSQPATQLLGVWAGWRDPHTMLFTGHACSSEPPRRTTVLVGLECPSREAAGTHTRLLEMAPLNVLTALTGVPDDDDDEEDSALGGPAKTCVWRARLRSLSACSLPPLPQRRRPSEALAAVVAAMQSYSGLSVLAEVERVLRESGHLTSQVQVP